MFGPLMGYGCPDRASLLIGQWAKIDPNFKKWAEYMDVEDEVSLAWAYAKSVILTPLADWASKVWKFWTLPQRLRLGQLRRLATPTRCVVVGLQRQRTLRQSLELALEALFERGSRQ